VPRKPVLKKKQTYRQSIFKLITANASDQDAEAVITVHHDAVLVGIDYAISYQFTTTADYAIVELSESGNFQGQTSDQGESLCVVNVQILGTDAVWGAENGNTSAMRVPFRAGDKIYLNSRGTNARALKCFFILHWEEQ